MTPPVLSITNMRFSVKVGRLNGEVFDSGQDLVLGLCVYLQLLVNFWAFNFLNELRPRIMLWSCCKLKLMYSASWSSFWKL